MDDDQKKQPRGGGGKGFGGERGRGPDKSASGDRKQFRKDGPKRSFGQRDDAVGGGKKPFRKDGPRSDRPARADGDRPKRPFVRRDDDSVGKPSGEKRPFRKDGARSDRPARADGDRPKRPFVRRDDDSTGTPSGEKGSFRKDGPRGDRPFRAEGDRPKRPFVRRDDSAAGAASGERKPFRKDGPGRPFAARDGAPERKFDDRKTYRPKREGESRSFGHGDAPEAGETGHVERIARRLARAGIASRRDAELLIEQGRVKVNGRTLDSPAVNVRADDRIELDGTEIPAVERTRLFLFHKPAGVVTTNRDPEGRRTVFDTLPEDLPRLMTIGRLDINTEGLLLLTNDGGLARVLELPATGWLRRYRVRVHGKVEQSALNGLKDGIAVDGVFYGAVEASLDREQGSNAWLTIGLREGKNREVKNILGALGLEVSRLIRISYGPFQLGELAEGEVQEIRGRMLRDQLGERLIEESGANFDAPIIKPFSRKGDRPASETEQTRPERPKIRRDGERGRIGEGGLIKKRKRREDSRGEALERLSTRPDRGSGPRSGKPAVGRQERPDKRGDRNEPSAAPRKANVWMAPGARPEGAPKKPSGTPAGSRPGKPDGQGRRGGPKGPRGNADRRR